MKQAAKYAADLAAYLETNGVDGSELGATDSRVCAEALRYYSDRGARRVGLAVMVAIPIMFAGVLSSDCDGNGKSLFVDLLESARSNH